MNVLLLKEPREDDSGPDPYIKELELYGHRATLIPVLSFTFVSLEELCQKLLQPEKYEGLIFTSPRAVEATRACLEANNKMEEWDGSLKDRWNTKPIYVVGRATAALARNLGLLPQGEDAGTASELSRFILERVPLETLTVYQTSHHPELEKNLTDYFSEKGIPAGVAFFSPSGVRFCLETLCRLSGPSLKQIKFAAIGPTTTDAMVTEGLTVSCSAAKPTPRHLAESIAQALR